MDLVGNHSETIFQSFKRVRADAIARIILVCAESAKAPKIPAMFDAHINQFVGYVRHLFILLYQKYDRIH